MDRIERIVEHSKLLHIRAFNTTYKIITKAVNHAGLHDRFEHPDWLEKLDILFAKYYFRALDDYTHHKVVPVSWNTLFSSAVSDNHPLYLYMAMGVNAHVNHDLSLTLYDVALR